MLLGQQPFELSNTGVQRCDRFRHFFWGEPRCNVLRAVPIKANDVDAENPFNYGALWDDELPDQISRLVEREHLSMANDLQPFARGVIHEEEGDPVTGFNIPGADQLAIAVVVTKSELSAVYHAQKTAGTAAMLDIWPATFADRRHIKTVARGDKGLFFRPEGL